MRRVLVAFCPVMILGLGTFAAAQNPFESAFDDPVPAAVAQSATVEGPQFGPATTPIPAPPAFAVQPENPVPAAFAPEPAETSPRFPEPAPSATATAPKATVNPAVINWPQAPELPVATPAFTSPMPPVASIPAAPEFPPFPTVEASATAFTPVIQPIPEVAAPAFPEPQPQPRTVRIGPATAPPTAALTTTPMTAQRDITVSQPAPVEPTVPVPAETPTVENQPTTASTTTVGSTATSEVRTNTEESPEAEKVEPRRGNVFFAPVSHVRTDYLPPRSSSTGEEVSSRRLIMQREIFHAQQRATRMQVRQWQGTSGLRPAIGNGIHSDNPSWRAAGQLRFRR